MQATDEDTNSILSYSLSPASVPFTISDAGQVRVTQPLDRESQDSYTLQVTASDGVQETTVVLEVAVTDVNDNPPVFAQSKYSKSISPRTDVGQLVLTVSATDRDAGANGIITYWLSGGRGVFIINPDSGDISVAGDLTSMTQTLLTVFARDFGYPSLMANATVHIYLNGSNAHRPEFQDFVYQTYLPEDVQVGTSVVTVTATDLDPGLEGQVILSIVDGNYNDTFTIDNNGVITTTKKLDYETRSTFELKVRAQDNGSDQKSTFAVLHVYILDVNDNPPVFIAVPDVITMQGPLLDSEPITILVAKDADHNNVTYSLLTENRRFFLDPQTGELNASSIIQEGSYNVTIQAEDSGTPMLATQVTFTLRVLGLGSFTSQALFDRVAYQVSVPETTRIPLLLLNMDAKTKLGQPDQGVTYNITQGQDVSLFRINSTTVSAFFNKNMLIIFFIIFV